MPVRAAHFSSHTPQTLSFINFAFTFYFAGNEAVIRALAANMPSPHGNNSVGSATSAVASKLVNSASSKRLHRGHVNKEYPNDINEYSELLPHEQETTTNTNSSAVHPVDVEIMNGIPSPLRLPSMEGNNQPPPLPAKRAQQALMQQQMLITEQQILSSRYN